MEEDFVNTCIFEVITGGTMEPCEVCGRFESKWNYFEKVFDCLSCGNKQKSKNRGNNKLDKWL